MRVRADPRHASRKLALASIFSWLFSEPDYDECLDISVENLLKQDETHDKDLLDFIVKGVQQNRDEIDQIIQECAPEWPIDKISKIDLVILRIAVFELVYGLKTPIKVSIDEAVELSKEFGTDTSHKFVNGVLGTVASKYTKQEGPEKPEKEEKDTKNGGKKTKTETGKKETTDKASDAKKDKVKSKKKKEK